MVVQQPNSYFFKLTSCRGRLDPWEGKFKGFGTERARLGTFNKKFSFFCSKREKTSSKPEVWHEKLKTVLPAVILKKKFWTSNFTKLLNP